MIRWQQTWMAPNSRDQALAPFVPPGWFSVSSREKSTRPDRAFKRHLQCEHNGWPEPEKWSIFIPFQGPSNSAPSPAQEDMPSNRLNQKDMGSQWRGWTKQRKGRAAGHQCGYNDDAKHAEDSYSGRRPSRQGAQHLPR